MNKTKKINAPSSRFSMAWNINLFRFWSALGMLKPAQKYFDRIPLPDQSVTEEDFFFKEQATWAPYLDSKGNLRPFSWSKMFLVLLVVGLTSALLTFFITGYIQQTGTIRIQDEKIDAQNSQIISLRNIIESTKKENEQTSSPPKTAPPQPLPEGCRMVKLYGGQEAILDTTVLPTFTNEQLYFAIVDAENNKRELQSQSTFEGEPISSDDDRRAMEFVGADDQKFYYTYFMNTAEKGEWMNQTDFEKWMRPISQAGPVFTIQTTRSLKMHMKPDNESDEVTTVPKGGKIEFQQYAPISTLSSQQLWIEVVYKSPNGTLAGWLPAFSLNSLYVKPEKVPNTLKLIPSEYLSFRTTPSIPPNTVTDNRLPEVPHILKGRIVTMLNYAPIDKMLSLKTLAKNNIMIQVEYKDDSGKTYTGWIAAAQVNQKNIAEIKTSK